MRALGTGMYTSEKVHEHIDKNVDDFNNSLDISAIPRISIVGVGGAGNNCINTLSVNHFSSVRTIAINTDRLRISTRYGCWW